MKILVESLKRMYKKGTLTKEQISERVAKSSISADGSDVLFAFYCNGYLIYLWFLYA